MSEWFDLLMGRPEAEGIKSAKVVEPAPADDCLSDMEEYTLINIFLSHNLKRAARQAAGQSYNPVDTHSLIKKGLVCRVYRGNFEFFEATT